MADRKVHVYESSDNEYRVEPKLVELKQGADTLKVRNHSNDELVFFVTAGAFSANNPQVTSLPPKALTTVGVPISQSSSGTLYVYQIMHPKSGKKAKANSDPVLIIEN
jgi:hypothetical protein